MFQSLLIQFIKNDVKDIVNTNYQNYEYGIDEILLLYYYYICSKNIYVINGNNTLNYILFFGNNLNCIFNYVINNLPLITLRDNLSIFALFIYNYDYITNVSVYNTFKEIFDIAYDVNINDIEHFINIIKENNIYKQYYKYLHLNSKEEFDKFLDDYNLIICNLYSYKKEDKICLVHRYIL